MQGIDISKIDNQKKQKEEKSFIENIGNALNKDISLFGSGFSDKKKESFYHELGILLQAGVDIKTTLEIITDNQVKEKDKLLFEEIKKQVVSGSTLSNAIKQSGQFSAYEFYSLQIGEETGKLPLVLKELAGYYQKKIKQKRQIIGALTYPSIVLATSVAAIVFMLNFIVPMFADIFKRFGGELPAITAFIIETSAFFSNYFYLIILFILGIVICIYSQRKTLWFRRFSSVLILKIPFVGELVRKIYLARFCHSMTLLISAKIPILRAITLVKQMIGFYPIEVSLDKIEKDILNGKSLHNSLSTFSIYPKRMISLIKVGEEVNQLEMFFEKVSSQYSDEVEHQTSLISSMVEPFMIIFLGVIVGFILIAMYLPLFQLSSHF
ncbi:MAG: type II secretion system F family protein [Cytophagaceae bacterium]